MKHGSNTRRSRNNRSGRRSNSRMQVFDSNGPDVRIRGNAMQVHEKYVALARDAAAGGDHILAESYLQHAEHYQRVLNEAGQNKNDQNKNKQQQNNKGKAPSVKELVPEAKDMTLADELQLREEQKQTEAKAKKPVKRAAKGKTEEKTPEPA